MLTMARSRDIVRFESSGIPELLLTLARQPAAEIAFKAVIALIRGDRAQEIPEEQRREVIAAVVELLGEDWRKARPDVLTNRDTMSPRIFGLLVGATLTVDVKHALVLLADYLAEPVGTQQESEITI